MGKIILTAIGFFTFILCINFINNEQADLSARIFAAALALCLVALAVKRTWGLTLFAALFASVYFGLWTIGDTAIGARESSSALETCYLQIIEDHGIDTSACANRSGSDRETCLRQRISADDIARVALARCHERNVIDIILDFLRAMAQPLPIPVFN